MMRLALFLLFSGVVHADFPKVYNSEPGEPRPTTPEQALAALHLPEGFKATLFAYEPDVQNPIALSWDKQGRMWVAENYTYAERQKRFDLSLRDRVIILEDKDWDGKAESRKVFTEDVQMLTSIEVTDAGVWLMCPPQALFIPDANHDDEPDGPPQVILDGFTVAKDNYHNFANGLRFGPDGWLYGRCGHSCPANIGVPGTPDDKRVPMKGGIWRYHPEKKIVEVLTHGTTNPWGHDWDENGEMFFINTVTGHLWHLIHGAHLVDSNTPNPLIYEKLDTIADHYHYDRSGSWSESRDGKANSLGGGHAHIGMMIYKADQWPEQYRNKLFTLNMHGRRANVERLERNGSGYVGKHEPDVFLSDDPWFRGIEISTGPDGSGFILDWSDTGECHESTGVHRTSGRIFRISYGDPKKPEKPFAWRMPWPKADLNGDEHQRALAIREMVQFWPLDLITGAQHPLADPNLEPIDVAMFKQLVSLAKSDKSSLVRLQLASVLQRLPLLHRAELAIALLSRTEDAEDPFLPNMIWFGISPLPADALLEVAKNCTWPKVNRWIARKLATDPQALNQLLNINSSDAVIEGVSEAFKGIRKAPKPSNWDNVARMSRSPLVRDLSILFGDGRALNDVKKTALDAETDAASRQAALRTLIDARPADLREFCESLLDDRAVNGVAVKGLALFGDPEIGVKLAKQYRKFSQTDRTAVLDVLVSRPAFVHALLDQVGDKKAVPRAELTAFHARQIRGFKDEALTKKLIEVWGELRDSSADKHELMKKLKTQLSAAELAKANLGNGRLMFTALCGSCHVMYGEGGKVGPDLTGSGRANLDYLLENIVDPSAVVSADYRMQMITLKDGRVVSGMIKEQTDRTLTVRQLTEELTVEKSEIAKQESPPVSMMPEGLLIALPDEARRDLIAYLMYPTQVPLNK
ncbi:MAG: c-type cytochrome [Verrucomicrobiaceae bacterium]|nr:c-type cytochrome [Verrucomicrobiaceae bacterium]